MIVIADSSAMLALVDRDQPEHVELALLYRKFRDGWTVPASTLPELDYLIARRIGAMARMSWLSDLEAGVFAIAWHVQDDLRNATRLDRQYRDLDLGYVDSMVMATAERLRADAIATLDLRHFGAVRLAGNPRLLPRGG
ncbi:MAG: PIN domain-containing protein [Terriglobales bacterium]